MNHPKTDAIQYAAAIGAATSTDLMKLFREMEEQRNKYLDLLISCEPAMRTAKGYAATHEAVLLAMQDQ